MTFYYVPEGTTRVPAGVSLATEDYSKVGTAITYDTLYDDPYNDTIVGYVYNNAYYVPSYNKNYELNGYFKYDYAEFAEYVFKNTFYNPGSVEYSEFLASTNIPDAWEAWKKSHEAGVKLYRQYNFGADTTDVSGYYIGSDGNRYKLVTNTYTDLDTNTLIEVPPEYKYSYVPVTLDEYLDALNAQEQDELDDTDGDYEIIDADYTVDTANKMKEFDKVLQSLNNKFCKDRAVYTMYLKITMRNGSVLVDSTSLSLVTNCFINFKHDINGTGQGNSFEVKLVFKPDDRTYLSIKHIEDLLLAYTTIYDINDNTKLLPLDDLYYNCTFQYGYADDTSLRSPKYNGLITDYDMTIENGLLVYKIYGTCGLSVLKEYRLTASNEEYCKPDNKFDSNTPMGYLANIFEVEFGNESNRLYKIAFANMKPSEIKYPGDGYKTFNQKNLFQLIQDVLSGCMTPEQYSASTGKSSEGEDTENPNEGEDNTSIIVEKYYPNQQCVFGYYIDDTSQKDVKLGTVVIYQMESLYGDENKDKTPESIQPDAEITFDWFAPSGGKYAHIVQSWNPKYEGSALMGMAATYLFADKNDIYYTMTDDGEVRAVRSFGAVRDGLSNSADIEAVVLSTVQEYSHWSFITQYPYSATMTIIGCPCEVPINGKIKVNAKIGTQTHHSSGVYIVLAKTDEMSNNGFFSTFTLFKLTVGFNPEYTETSSDFIDYQSRIDALTAENENITAQINDLRTSHSIHVDGRIISLSKTEEDELVRELEDRRTQNTTLITQYQDALNKQKEEDDDEDE